jgi:diadenosine tetraphosphate (Ap4A) HIT family hydrolase
VYHLHLHVVPRYRDDGFGKIWAPQRDTLEIDLEGVADKVRNECRSINSGKE